MERPPVFRHTKVIVTLGPASESEEQIGRLIAAGANVFRLNMAHAKPDWTRRVIGYVRAAGERLGQPVAVLMDVKGPEIRTGDLAEPLQLCPGDRVDFAVSSSPTPSPGVPVVFVNYPGLIDDVPQGTSLLVDNGLLRFEVLSKQPDRLCCRALIRGELTSRRHINLPGVRVNLPSFTEKDRANTLLGIELEIDLLALSFVRTAADIEEVREFLATHGSPARLVAKIEDQQAISNLEEIIRACDVLMVARGDLGVECPFEELPILQRRAVKACLVHGRPVIIATHMLESMIESPMPTRAEITDVANAVFEEADCVMLSGETSIGRYPAECAQILDKVARRIERSGGAGFADGLIAATEKAKVLRAATVMANQIRDCALIVFTRQGFMAQALAALRPRRAPIFAFTPSASVERQLQVVRGVQPARMAFESDPENTVERAIAHLLARGWIRRSQRLVVVSDILSGDRRIDSIQLRIAPE